MRAFHEFALAVMVNRRIGGVSRSHGFAMCAARRNGAVQGLATAGAKHRNDFSRIQRQTFL